MARWAALGYAQQISGADEPHEMNQTYPFLSSSTTSIHHLRDSSLRYDVHLQYILGPNGILRLAVLARSGFLPPGQNTPWTTDEAYSLCLFYLIICRRQNLIRDGKAINWCSFPPVSQTPSSVSHQETKRSLLSSIFKPQLKHYLLYRTSRFPFLEMQLINILYFITAVTAVAIPATTESEVPTTSVDYDPVLPTAQILHTNTY